MTTTHAGVALRAPTAADRARVRSMVEAAGVFRPDEVPIALEVFDGAVTAPETDYWSVVAEDDGTVIGWAAFGPTPCTLGTWDLYWIVVDPGRQRGGVGRALMRHCEATAAREGARLLVVETSSRADYGPTRAFYERLDYDAEAIIRDYYAPGDHLVVYVNRLVSPENEQVSHG